VYKRRHRTKHSLALQPYVLASSASTCKTTKNLRKMPDSPHTQNIHKRQKIYDHKLGWRAQMQIAERWGGGHTRLYVVEGGKYCRRFQGKMLQNITMYYLLEVCNIFMYIL